VARNHQLYHHHHHQHHHQQFKGDFLSQKIATERLGVTRKQGQGSIAITYASQ
jgi:hypothetical protein